MNPTYTFLKHMEGVSKNTNKPYNFVTLTDGRQEFSLFVNKDTIIADGLTEGDEVTPIVRLYRNNQGFTGVSLVKLS